MYKIYVKLNGSDMIVGVDSDVFLTDTTGWVQIDEGDGDRYLHAQGNYLPGPLMDEQCRYRYKLVDGAVAERGPEELEAEGAPPQAPSYGERLEALEGAMLEMILGGGADG